MGALILVMLAGIIAGATGALVGDRRTFHYLLIAALGPVPIGVVLGAMSSLPRPWCGRSS